MAERRQNSHRRIVIGVEIEAYSIDVSDYTIGRRLSRPRPGVSEAGERFSRDSSIGSEYISRPFETVREALFLLKAGLRKYLRGLYRSRDDKPVHVVPLLVGGWTNRFAGAHIHISVAGRSLSRERAGSLAKHLHDQIPFLIALGANSPIWDKRITAKASSRFLRGSTSYFAATRRGRLTSVEDRELIYSPGRKTKPPTVELRVLDSNIPEYIVACLCVIKAASLRWLRGERPANRIRHDGYLRARHEAATKGMRAKLPWGKNLLPVPDYLDRFLWEHRRELEEMDIPDEIFEVWRILKRGYNGARLIHDAAVQARREHPLTWQRRFARRYVSGLEELLSGNSLRDFAEALGVALPATKRVWLGRKGASIDE